MCRDAPTRQTFPAALFAAASLMLRAPPLRRCRDGWVALTEPERVSTVDVPGCVSWWPRPEVKLSNVMVDDLTETNRQLATPTFCASNLMVRSALDPANLSLTPLSGRAIERPSKRHPLLQRHALDRGRTPDVVVEIDRVGFGGVAGRVPAGDRFNFAGGNETEPPTFHFSGRAFPQFRRLKSRLCPRRARP